MAYDGQLADRIRALTEERGNLTEVRMFGALGFLLNGNMCCGVMGSDLIVRLSEEAAEMALLTPNTREFSPTGRPMTGWVVVGAPETKTDDALALWLSSALAFTQTLPPKSRTRRHRSSE